jgi:ATP-dependent DNA helicase RecG
LRALAREGLRRIDEGLAVLSDRLDADAKPTPAHPNLREALRLLHRPAPMEEPLLPAARERLAFEELLAQRLGLMRLRAETRQHGAPPLRLPLSLADDFRAGLPFPLTAAQQRVNAEIERDLGRERPMMRLLQGDVGSGKTVVAARAALTAVASGWQVAVMAPTELLAEQHFANISVWLAPLGVQTALLLGRFKGQQRIDRLEQIRTGDVGVIIGTHALFQREVRFDRLGLVIIDEQHRFGVHQRLALRDKGNREGLFPHQLIMTATPIPRTRAMVDYADLDFSIIDELPPGRTAVKTTATPGERRGEVIARIADWVARGRQAYWVCTLIDESELLQCEAAENTAQLLRDTLPGVRVGLLHGRLKGGDKDAVMQQFKQRELDLLVSTTVIEVGVDVPNAGLMIIENAERFGLAQLHQLRGRVGRGPGESFCVLLYQSPLSQTARQRLDILRRSHDGFEIAEKDWELRGSGELLGTRQTGVAGFRTAELPRDGGLLPRVAEVCDRLMREDPTAPELLIRRWVGQSMHYAEV